MTTCGLVQWSNVGVPRRLWGTKAEPGPSWYNNAGAPHNCVGGSEVQCPISMAQPPPPASHWYKDPVAEIM